MTTVAVSVSATSATLCHVTTSLATVPVNQDGQDQHVIMTLMNARHKHTTAPVCRRRAATPRVDTAALATMGISTTMRPGSVWVSREFLFQ